MLFYSLLKASYGVEELLGVRVKEGIKTLIIQYDESERVVKGRLELAGIDKDDDVWVLTDGYRLSDIDLLDQLLTETGAELLVIDSLSQLLLAEGLDENKADAAKPLVAINKLTQKHNCSVLVVHHTNKSSDSKGVAKMRGSSSLAAVGDGLLIVDYDAMGGSNARVITSIPRNGEQRAIDCLFDFEELDLSLAENERELEAVYTPDTRNTESAILGLLGVNPNGLLQTDLAGELGLKTVKMQLSRLKSKGLIYSVQEGKYKRYFLIEKTEVTNNEPEVTSLAVTSSEPPPSKGSNKSNELLPLGRETLVTSVTSEKEEGEINLTQIFKRIKPRLFFAGKGQIVPYGLKPTEIEEGDENITEEIKFVIPDDIVTGAEREESKELNIIDVEAQEIYPPELELTDKEETSLTENKQVEIERGSQKIHLLTRLDLGRIVALYRSKGEFDLSNVLEKLGEAKRELMLTDKHLLQKAVAVRGKKFKYFRDMDWIEFIVWLVNTY